MLMKDFLYWLTISWPLEKFLICSPMTKLRILSPWLGMKSKVLDCKTQEKITQIFSPRHLFFLCPREFFSQLVFHVEMQRCCKVFLRFSSTAHFQDSWLLTTHWYNKEVVRKINFDEFSAQWFLYYLFRQFWHENSYFG